MAFEFACTTLALLPLIPHFQDGRQPHDGHCLLPGPVQPRVPAPRVSGVECGEPGMDDGVNQVWTSGSVGSFNLQVSSFYLSPVIVTVQLVDWRELYKGHVCYDASKVWTDP